MSSRSRAPDPDLSGKIAAVKSPPEESYSAQTYEVCSYSVVIRTGTQPDAGTYANVFVQVGIFSVD
jgi:hypothetical protein